MELKTLVSDYFKSINWNIEPQNLYSPIDYALQSGGKRLRPLLVLMATELFGGEVEKALKPAVAMEIFHNFTLLHDDVMDKADIRRGRPTVCNKWDTNTAILSGDAMLIKAYQYLEEIPADKLLPALQLFSKTAIEVCEGQQYDGDFETRNDVSIEEYFEMIRLKTAVLLAGCLKMGAVLADASDHDAQAIYDFGIAIGIAFQLRDDYLDCYGDEKTFGKKIGGDITTGKRTFLLINALKRCNVSQRQTIMQFLENKNIGTIEEKISIIIDIYTQLGLPELCNQTINEYYQIAIDALDCIDKPASAKQPLIDLAKQLMGRND